MKNATLATTKNSTKGKTVTPLFRVQVKSNNDVIYRVRNGENREYLVTIHPDGTSACTQCANDEPCPSSKSGRKCYHIKECVKLEEARTDKLPANARTMSPKCPVNVPTDGYVVAGVDVTSFATDDEEFRDDPALVREWAEEALSREAYVQEFCIY